MLCSLCQHGVTSKIGGKPTGRTWDCACGETNCRHLAKCPKCERLRRSARIRFDYNADEDRYRLQGLHPEGVRCLIRALCRELKQGDRYVAHDILRTFGPDWQKTIVEFAGEEWGA